MMADMPIVVGCPVCKVKSKPGEASLVHKAPRHEDAQLRRELVTVAELRELLQQLPQDALVYYDDDDRAIPVTTYGELEPGKSVILS